MLVTLNRYWFAVTRHCKDINKYCNHPNVVYFIHMDKAGILSKLIDIYADGNKSRFAQMMGTTPQNIGNWIRRGTIPYEEIYKICVGVNPHWLLTGEGEPLSGSPETGTPPQIKEEPHAEERLLDRLEAQAKKIGILEFRLEEEQKAHNRTKEQLRQAEYGIDHDRLKSAGDVDANETALAHSLTSTL